MERSTWDGTPLEKRIANCLKGSPKKSLSILCIASMCRPATTAATTDYIHPFSAALHKDNFYATQFHPEKSGKTGEKILTNFLNL